MRRYTHQTTTTLSPEQLFRAIADIRRWPEWDADIEATTFEQPLKSGAQFTLKPKGGPRVRLEIESLEAPYRFADIAFLPLARMRTIHEFSPTDSGAMVRTTIEIAGPLGFLWDKIVARPQAAGLDRQSRNFLAFAERLS